MSASKQFTDFCKELGGTPKKENKKWGTLLECRFSDFHELKQIDVTIHTLTMKDKAGKTASLDVDRVVVTPNAISYKVGDWLLDSTGGTLEGVFKLTGIRGEANTTDDELKVFLSDEYSI